VHYAVESIAKACIVDADGVLCSLLDEVIAYCVGAVGMPASAEPLRHLAAGKDLPVRRAAP
jgi:hypothetical protein